MSIRCLCLFHVIRIRAICLTWQRNFSRLTIFISTERSDQILECRICINFKYRVCTAVITKLQQFIIITFGYVLCDFYLRYIFICYSIPICRLIICLIVNRNIKIRRFYFSWHYLCFFYSICFTKKASILESVEV